MTEKLKLPEVARRLGVSEKTARRYVKAGVLPSVFVGNAYRVREEDVERYVRQARVPVGAVPPKAAAPSPPENGARGSKEATGAQASPQEATFDAEAHGRALAAQWRAALDAVEEAKARPAVYGAQLFRLLIDVSRTRRSFEEAAQGGYASRPEFRETLRLMDMAHSTIKAETKDFLDSLTGEMAERTAREFKESFEREGVELDAP